MVSYSTEEVVVHRHSKDKSNDAINDKENRKILSSSTSITRENVSKFELLEARQQRGYKMISKTKPDANSLSSKSNNTKYSRSSGVWQYAMRDINSNYATCCLCKDHKRISTNNGSTSTLRKHLILKHNIQELILPAGAQKSKKILVNPIQKQYLHDLSINCIIRDSRTFNDLQKSGMKRLLQELVPGYEPPTRYTVTRRLKRLHVFHHKKLINDLENVNDISITMDLWTNKQMRCFLAITGHYFYSNSYDVRSTILNFSTFDKRHTSIEISRILEAKLKELNILQKVGYITCDGGKNMVCAIDNMGLNVKRVWCVAHRLHLTITNALSFWVLKNEVDEGNGMIEETDLFNEMHDQEADMTNLEDLQDDDEMDMDITNDLEFDDNEPLEGVYWNDEEELLFDTIDEEIIDNWTEDVNQSDVDTAPDQEMIIYLLKKCRALISTVKRSTIITLFFDNERKKLNIKRNLCYDVKSRWNSTYNMIDSLLFLREVIEKLFDYKNYLHLKPKQLMNLARYELTNDEWNMLSDLHFVLKPFFHATKVMSGCQYPSIGIAYYLLMRLKHFLQQNDKKQNITIKRLKQLLLAKFLFYFENDYQQMQLLKFHAYFDPAGFLALTDPEKRFIEQNIKSLLANETFELTQSATATSDNCATTMDTSIKLNLHEKSDKSTIDMFHESVGELTHEEQPRDSNQKSKIINDILNYRKYATQFNLKRKPDVSSSTIFWNTYGQNFSILGKLAKKMLSPPATSVPSESCFSVSAFLGRKERTRLTGENLSSSVFLKDKIVL